MIRLTLSFCLCLAVTATADSRPSPGDRASELFASLQERVCQIRVIDRSSGKKSAIGSGFAIESDGLFATNYHVVSDMVMEPGRYRLEYVASDGATGNLTLLDIDVVHDLAIVAGDSARSGFMTIAGNVLGKGSRIYAMGNPLDLGMTIIEGTYSGYIAQSLYEKIHFSGSLNPGMSGGPAIDENGAVVGVNVSTAGQEISFLVPAARLRALLDSVKAKKRAVPVDFTKRIEQQLFENQQRYMAELLGRQWKQDTLGRVLVPREMGAIFKCWGETKSDSETLYSVSSVYCANDDDIFLSNDLSTGSITFNYHWYETSRLGKLRFYRMLQEQTTGISVPNYAAEKEIARPRCVTRFVATAGARWKTVLCTWQYKKYPRLHDVTLKVMLCDRPSQNLTIDCALLGVSRESALAFCKKFMESLQWLD